MSLREFERKVCIWINHAIASTLSALMVVAASSVGMQAFRLMATHQKTSGFV